MNDFCKVATSSGTRGPAPSLATIRAAACGAVRPAAPRRTTHEPRQRRLRAAGPGAAHVDGDGVGARARHREGGRRGAARRDGDRLGRVADVAGSGGQRARLRRVRDGAGISVAVALGALGARRARLREASLGEEAVRRTTSALTAAALVAFAACGSTSDDDARRSVALQPRAPSLPAPARLPPTPGDLLPAMGRVTEREVHPGAATLGARLADVALCEGCRGGITDGLGQRPRSRFLRQSAVSSRR